MEQHRVGQTKVIARGVIRGPEAGGEVVLESSSQGEVLRLEDYWIAQGAPDVRIYLTPDNTGNVEVDEAVDFGRVSAFSGLRLSYPIPKDRCARQMHAVVVCCKVYSVTFGVAVLDHHG